MTNVRSHRPAGVSGASICSATDTPAAHSDHRGSRVGYRFGRLIACAMICLCSVTGAEAQGPAGPGAPTVDVNRNGIGFSARAGHVAGDTVGRIDSVSLFHLSPYVNIGNGLLFGDARLNYGNEGGLAYTFGGGYRQYIPAWDAVIGANIFSDRDDLTGAHFRQWGAGAEILAHGWEVRGNVYSPYGNKSRQIGSRVNPGSAEFQGNNVIFDRIDTFSEALQGFDAEMGWLMPGKFSERIDLRVFGGGYYYEGEGVPGFSGFSTRMQADIKNWLELGLKLTDDEVFHTNVSFSAIVHFGGFSSQEHTSRSGMQRMAEPVRRNLNVAAVTTDITIGGQVAQAADGTPLTIIHVDSNAGPGGTGTVENPFNSLSTGLGFAHPEISDVVFTHAGSEFTAAPDNIVVLNSDQSLFGEGLIRVESAAGGFIQNRKVVNTVVLPGIGDLVLPDSPTFENNLAILGPDPFGPLPETTPLDPLLLRPRLANAGGDAVTLGIRSRLGGFILDSPTGNGITIDGVSDTSVRDTLVLNAGGTGILVQNTPGGSTTQILDTVIDGAIGPAFHVNGGAGAVGFTASSQRFDPAYGAIFNTSAEAVLIENRTGGSVNMLGSTIDDVGGAGIVIRDNTGIAVLVDNASITDSTGTGVSITNAAGTGGANETYTFRNTVRAATTITNAADSSVRIDGVPAGSVVTFENLDIQSPQSFGIEIDNLGGTFSFVRDLTIGAPPNASPAAAISVVDSLATAAVRFGGDVTIQGISPEPASAPPVAERSFTRGIELVNNATGSTFSIQGDTNITAASGESIAIINNGGTVNFVGNVGIRQRGVNGTGILIDSSTGTIAFSGLSTTVEHLPLGAANPNIARSTAPGVEIRNSQSSVSFEQLNVHETLLSPAVLLVDNRPGALGSARIFIDELNINDDPLNTPQNPGPGLVASNNEAILINDGILNTVGAAAVDIENSGINITFESVSTDLSPNYGIRLVETNVEPSLNTFIVNGDGTPASGGIIQNTAAGALTLTDAGIILQNAGEVTLNHMLLDTNNIGILVNNSGLTEDDEQFLHLNNVQVFDSDLNGIFATNLHRLQVAENSEFISNGTNALLAEDADTIRLLYTERQNLITTTQFNDFDNPFEVIIAEGTQLEGDFDDLITITNTSTAEGAHIDVFVQDNVFLLNDRIDIAGDEEEQAFEMLWNGVARVQLNSNDVQLLGAPGAAATAVFDQEGFVLEMDSRTDELLLDVLGNVFTSQAQPQSTAFRLETRGAPTSAVIANNVIGFDANRSIGLLFNLGPNLPSRQISILNNTMVFNGDGGTGIRFDRIQEPQRLAIGGNIIALTDFTDIAAAGGGLEAGIEFSRVVGVVNLVQGANNSIFLQPTGNIFQDIDTFFDLLPTQANGVIQINGALVP